MISDCCKAAVNEENSEHGVMYDCLACGKACTVHQGESATPVPESLHFFQFNTSPGMPPLVLNVLAPTRKRGAEMIQTMLEDMLITLNMEFPKTLPHGNASKKNSKNK